MIFRFPEDPLSCLIAVIALSVAAVVAFFLALFVLVPIALLTIAAILGYRYYWLQRVKAKDHVPATIREREDYLTPSEFKERIARKGLLRKYEEETGSYSCEPLVECFNEIATALYSDESFVRPPPQPSTTDRITIGKYYDQLEAWQRKVSDDSNLDAFLFVVLACWGSIREFFPSFALTAEPEPVRSPITTQLTLSDQDEACKAVIAELWQPDVKQRKLFEGLREQIEKNGEENEKEFAFAATFARTAWRQLLRVRIPITIFDETRFQGMWVCAPQGSGKTTLLHAILADDMEKDASIILMDSKGDLIQPFIDHPALARRRIIIGPDNPVGLNPLDIPRTDINKAVENLEYLFSSLVDFKLTGTQSMLLKAVLRALITVFPDPDLATFQELMARDGERKFAHYIEKLDSDLRNFFAHEYNTVNIRERRGEVLQRLRALLDHDLIRTMFMAPKTTFRIGEAMDQGAVIIINNSRGRLGNKGAEFLGRFFVAQVLSAAQERSFRSERDKKPVYFFIDEAHTVVAQDERITDVLHECRSQKIGLCVAHQETSQVSEKVLSAFQNCAIRFAHPDEELRRMSLSLRMDPRKLVGLKRGQFGAYVRGLAKHGIVVDVQKADLSELRPSLQPYQPRRLPPPSPQPSGVDDKLTSPEPMAEPISAPAATTSPPPKPVPNPPRPDAAVEWTPSA